MLDFLLCAAVPRRCLSSGIRFDIAPRQGQLQFGFKGRSPRVQKSEAKNPKNHEYLSGRAQRSRSPS